MSDEVKELTQLRDYDFQRTADEDAELFKKEPHRLAEVSPKAKTWNVRILEVLETQVRKTESLFGSTVLMIRMKVAGAPEDIDAWHEECCKIHSSVRHERKSDSQLLRERHVRSGKKLDNPAI